MLTTITHLIQQANDAGVGRAGADLFWNTTPGKVLGAILGAVGVVVVLITAVKGFSFISQGKPGQAFKAVFVAIVLCVFLFRPTTMNDLIDFVGGMFRDILGDAEKIRNEVGTNGSVPSTLPEG